MDEKRRGFPVTRKAPEMHVSERVSPLSKYEHPTQKNQKVTCVWWKNAGKDLVYICSFFNFGPIFDGSSWSMGVGYPPEGSQTREKHRKWTFQNVVPPSPNMSVQLQKTKKLERFEKKKESIWYLFLQGWWISWLQLHLRNQSYEDGFWETSMRGGSEIQNAKIAIFQRWLHQDGWSHGQKVLYIKWSPGWDLFYAEKNKFIRWISRNVTPGCRKRYEKSLFSTISGKIAHF